MTHNFWLSRWEHNDIGFHKTKVHHDLIRHIDRLDLRPGDTLFVPLCGKSLDMLWLRQRGIRIIGNELSQTAIESFFAENNLEVVQQATKDFSRYCSEGLELLCGDFFSLQRPDLQGTIAAYDRAALVALPPDLRRQYAEHLAHLLPAQSRVLLISYEYDQSEISGPPFSAPRSEVATLFNPAFEIELLGQADTLHTHLGLKARGVSKLTEFVCLLTRRND